MKICTPARTVTRWWRIWPSIRTFHSDNSTGFIIASPIFSAFSSPIACLSSSAFPKLPFYHVCGVYKFRYLTRRHETVNCVLISDRLNSTNLGQIRLRFDHLAFWIIQLIPLRFSRYLQSLYFEENISKVLYRSLDYSIIRIRIYFGKMITKLCLLEFQRISSRKRYRSFDSSLHR